ncbi:ubiquitin carboxyl-terminal hydrolase 37-like, partial [Anneissia japonica]|uniref:ubiquitin carboxyl-terminal hydrolase 37-like n=1 Tax=Anneissia japonica TaxID=1529436 RepID=UPI001425AF9D
FSNLGNTCYMNAILQSLFSLEPFVNDVLNNDVHKDMPRESLYKAVFQLIQAKKKDKGTSEIQTLLRYLKSAISNTATRFSGYLQHVCSTLVEYFNKFNIN